MQYVYGSWRKGKLLCEGLMEQIKDTSDTYEDLVIFKRKLSQTEEKENDLIYLGEIEG